ncbi:T9SS type A sorting domain-containing protein [Psychroserpens damuponensis]|uniref:T9SS type A sorting domain-containing protein n=1 Tax=Psychroserpens damuponensis TaxID=943936 RepID=UPI00058C9DFA|nr:T9SS type A sorting domain-containing protein [Psychroserpens damuponensis]
MKKTTLKHSNNLSKRLAQYGVLSLAIAGVSEANGQIQYTDVDPDFVGTLQSSFDVDFNGDTIVDAVIEQTSFSSSGGGNIQLMRAIAPVGNGIAANIVGNYTYGVNVPYGSAIGSTTTVASFGDMCQAGGYTNSGFCGTTADSYVGVAFDISGSTHYGWVRLEMGSSSSNFTVKDFAYEQTADASINAGDGLLSVDEFANNTFTHSYNKDTNNLTLNSSLPLSSIEVFNILGQRVINQSLSQSNEVIGMSNLQDGMYIAKVSVKGQTQTIKIIKQ